MAVMLYSSSFLSSFFSFIRFLQVSQGRKTKIQNKQEHTGVKDNESSGKHPVCRGFFYRIPRPDNYREMTIAVIKSRIRKSIKRFDVNMTFIISPVVSHTLLPCLFQLVSNLLFHFLRQNATVRDFLVIHQVFVEVSEIQSVELNFLQLINRNPRQSGLLALPNPIRNCPLRPCCWTICASFESNWQ